MDRERTMPHEKVATTHRPREEGISALRSGSFETRLRQSDDWKTKLPARAAPPLDLMIEIMEN